MIAVRMEAKKQSRYLRNNMTAAERKLWYEYLNKHKYRFLRQKPIGSYIVDFYCPKLKLIIEVDGVTHLSKDEIKKDNLRTEILKKYGIKVLRFWNDDVLNGINIICGIIDNKIAKIDNKSSLRKGNSVI